MFAFWKRRPGRHKRQRDSFMPWIQMLVDAATAYGLLRAAFWFRFDSGFCARGIEAAYYAVYQSSFTMIVFILVFFLRYHNLYQPSRSPMFGEEVWRVVKAVAAAMLVLMATTFFIRGVSFSRSFLLLSAPVLGLGLSFERWLVGLVIMWIDRRRGSFRNILVVGGTDSARRIVTYYRKHARFSTRVIGFLDDQLPVGSVIEGAPVLGRAADLKTLLRDRKDIHEVVLATRGVSQEAVLGMIFECEKEMVSFRWIADVLGLITSKMSVAYFGGVPVLAFTESPLGDWENRFLKRSMDIALSGLALLLLWPLFIVLAVLIKLDSPGPVFYRQKRIGEDGRRFKLLKFRTMREAPKKAAAKTWTTQNDPRRTRIGTALRKLNLDELPQLGNVLMGDMSLVGPRPERPFFVRQFREDIPRYMARHTIRSGITGWAQVNGLRGDTSIEERTKYDLYYIENWSLLFDIKILFRTVFTIFSSRNAY
ncbi:MAG TPA: undecaprenyl-phosphate glucose phosphotransferase [Candidatus Eisenbacteria bacterium]|jgi:Undecaprenyl-phosphate glucose phosphotransferase|nr:undecaprenyl-phosphate glucose phosphotransferase [Candidatus Eisenbacteria bacterium]